MTFSERIAFGDKRDCVFVNINYTFNYIIYIFI